MEFRQIQSFACLYEEGSVTRAAQRLNIVQPALSMQIARLEAELGRPLFHRSTKGMVPTPAGVEMYRLFLPVLSEFQRAHAQVTGTPGELRGQARLGLVASIAQEILPEALAEFAPAHPRVTVSVTEAYTQALAEAVADGRLDAAIVNRPRRRIALHAEPVLEEDIVLVSGPAHARLPAKVPLREVTRLRLVLPTRQHGLRVTLDAFAEAEGLAFDCAAEIDSLNAILHLVERSALATLVPRTAVRSRLGKGRLRAHQVVEPPLLRHLSCITHPRRPPEPAAAAFLEVLLRHIRRQSGRRRAEPLSAPRGSG